MPSRLFASLCIALLFASVSPAARGQGQPEYSGAAEDLFQQGLVYFRAGRFTDAASAFASVIQRYPGSHRATAAYVMEGKALFRSNDNLDAARTLKAFLAKYPGSSYVPDADLMLGQIYDRIGRYEEAMLLYLEAWRMLPPLAPAMLTREIMFSMDRTIDGHMDARSVQRLVNESTSARERAYFWLKIAQKDLDADRTVAAGEALDSLTQRYPGNPFADQIARLRATVSGRGSVKLGVLMPLMKSSPPSGVKEVGNEVNNGVTFAFDEFQRDPSVRVRIALDIRDTDRDSGIALREARALAEDPGVVGVIGPVFSSETSAAAAGLGTGGIPLVSPTANADGIAAAGPAVFQANPDYATRGRVIARYAIEKKGYRTFAVLAPGDSYGKFLADGFIDEVNRLGGKIVATQWYAKGASDLKPQLRNIRRAGLHEGQEPMISFAGRMGYNDRMKYVGLGVPLRRLDSLMERSATVSATALLGPDARAIIDSMGLVAAYDDSQVDSTQYPVTTIQAVYLPITSPDEIGVVSSQIVYFNIQAQLLGSGEWYKFSELDANKRYCNNVIFESDSYVDTSSASYRDLARRFAAQGRGAPTRYALYGYDTARLTLSLLASGATSRETLARALSGVRDYQGVHSRIGFSGGRVNGWLHILQYVSDSIVHLDEIGVDVSGGGASHVGR